MLGVIRYVYAVYEEKSFSKAAKKLFITQPALSAMVKKAEMGIGCAIFDRSTVPLTVTEEGQYYIDSIEKIILVEDNLKNYYADLDNLKSGHLSIGGSSYFCSYVLADIIGKFKETYPDVKVDLFEGNLEELKKKLVNNKLDLIIETALTEKDDTLSKYLVGYEDIIVVVPSHFQINTKLKKFAMSFNDVQEKKYQSDDVLAVPMNEFKNTPFLLMKKGNDMYTRGINICRNAGFTPKCSMYLDQMLTSFFISQTGVGAVFMRASLYKFLPETDKMVYYKIADPLARRPVYMASQKGRYICKSAVKFLEMLGAEVEEDINKV